MGFNNNNNNNNNNYNYNIRAEVETHPPKLHDSFYFSPALPSLTSYGPLSHELYEVLQYPGIFLVIICQNAMGHISAGQLIFGAVC